MTYSVDLEVVQPRRRKQGLAHHLHLLEPLPARALRDGVVVEEHAGVFGEPRAVGADEEDGRPEALVVQVEAVLDALLEGGAVEERHVVVDVGEEEIDELREQVGRREVLVRLVLVLHVRRQPLIPKKNDTETKQNACRTRCGTRARNASAKERKRENQSRPAPVCI